MDNVKRFEEIGMDCSTIRIVGGSTKSPFWCQMKADALGKRLEATKNPEGAAIGAASAQKQEENRRHNHHQYDYSYDDDIYYGDARDYSYIAPATPAAYLSIDNVVFADNNGNRVLEGGETAYLTFDIHNTSSQPIYNIAPVITCNNRRIKISPTATIARIDAGRAMRYKAVVMAQGNVRSGQAIFNIGFAERGNRLDPARSFRINVRR